MLKNRVVIVCSGILFGVLVLTSQLQAQPTVNFKGLTHNWFSVNGEGMGFVIRRVRLKAYGSLDDNLDWFCQYGWGKQKPSLVDAGISYKFNQYLNLTAGQFVAPGSVFGALTSVSKLTFVERALIVREWKGHTGYSGYRSVGVQADGDYNNFHYSAMLSNKEAKGLYSPSISDDVYAGSDPLRLSTRLEYNLDNIKTGIFISSPLDDNEDGRSYGVDLILDYKAMEYAGGYIGGNNMINNSDNSYYGFFGRAAWAFNDKIEPAVRYDYYNPSDNGLTNVDIYHNITLGLNYYYSKNVKVQCNYLFRGETMEGSLDSYDNNMLYVNLQYTFNSK